jgi:hypothetical protein
VRRQGGGWQSGAAGETPTGRLAPAIGPKDDGGEESATDNRPAEVAMGGMSSYTARPDCTAARHTDARSLAVPVPRGTLIPTASAVAHREAAKAPRRRPTPIARDGPPDALKKVYAPDDRLRIFFHTANPQARRVPEPLKNSRLRPPGRKARSRCTTAGRDHESRGHFTVPDRRWVGKTGWKFCKPEPTPRLEQACGPTRFANLGMFGCRSKFLAETPGGPPRPGQNGVFAVFSAQTTPS